jgi:hypothetical protein
VVQLPNQKHPIYVPERFGSTFGILEKDLALEDPKGWNEACDYFRLPHRSLRVIPRLRADLPGPLGLYGWPTGTLWSGHSDAGSLIACENPHSREHAISPLCRRSPRREVPEWVDRD